MNEAKPHPESPGPENPITGMLRDGGKSDRSVAAVATSTVLHLSLAGVVVFASAFAVAPPPPVRRCPIVFRVDPPAPPPPLAKKGVERPPREKPEEVERRPDPVRPPVTRPEMVVPTVSEARPEIMDIPYGRKDGSDEGIDPEGDPNGSKFGKRGGIGDVIDAPPVDLGPPETVTRSFEQARLISRVDPVYPTIARKITVEGVVILEAIIDTDGTVVEVSVLRSIPLLDTAAADAVRQWRFEPGFQDGRPVRQRLTVSVNFRLNR